MAHPSQSKEWLQVVIARIESRIGTAQGKRWLMVTGFSADLKLGRHNEEQVGMVRCGFCVHQIALFFICERSESGDFFVLSSFQVMS